MMMLSGSARSQPAGRGPPRREARLLKSWDIAAPAASRARFDPSGLAFHRGSWLVVSDKPEFPDIYRLRPDGPGRLAAESFVRLSPEAALAGRDFEGLAFCRGRFLIVEEESGTLVEADPRGAASAHDPELAVLHESRSFAPSWGTKGAGLEGVACDERTGEVYVAQERQYRMIYRLDPLTLKATDFFDVPAGWESPRFLGKTPVYPDYADLFFEGGFLYALQRNDRRLLKIDPGRKALVEVAELGYREEDFYESPEPFGMAEGLHLSRDRIRVVLDNNGTIRRGEPASAAAMLLEFERPAGF